MPKLTPAMQRKQTQHEKRADAVAAGKEASSSEPPAPVPLKVMLKQGEIIEVEGADGKALKLEIGRILIKDQSALQELSASFDVMLLLALANSYDDATEEYDMDKMAFLVNNICRVGSEIVQEKLRADLEQSEALEQAEAPEELALPIFTPEDCADQVNLFTSQPFSADTQTRMSQLVALILSRKQPQITAEQIDQWLDLTAFLAIARTFYQVNPSARNRFA